MADRKQTAFLISRETFGPAEYPGIEWAYNATVSNENGQLTMLPVSRLPWPEFPDDYQSPSQMAYIVSLISYQGCGGVALLRSLLSLIDWRDYRFPLLVGAYAATPKGESLLGLAGFRSDADGFFVRAFSSPTDRLFPARKPR